MEPSRYHKSVDGSFFFSKEEKLLEKYDAIYGRQSVDREDSISIESQIEYCQYETRGGRYKTFADKGYSGKNTARPQFQEMLEAIRRGEVKRVICYKLDRISRSILDFATMMAEFQEYGVEFVSCTEKFDTSTPMGRAMLNICIVFAQLERETIQMRVCDAYVSRSRKGFYMGGRIPYGYKKEPHVIDGKRTSHYVPIPEEAEIVRLIFSMYARPQTSYGDIVRYLLENGIVNSRSKNGAWDRCRIAEMIKNPIYVRADLDVYRFYRDQGTNIHNSPEDFIGHFGCYLFSEKGAGRKQCHLNGQHLVLAPHEGIVASDIWLKARVKCLNNKQVTKPLKASNTWLAGKIKCGKCGYALTIRKCRLKTRTVRYFICSRRMQTNRCEGVGGILADDFEAFVLQEMREHIRQFETLTPPLQAPEDPRVHALNVKIEQTTEEISKLLDKVSSANDVLMDYINRRAKELDTQLTSYREEISQLSPIQSSRQCDVGQIRGYMEKWDMLRFEDKRAVVDQLIFVIKAAQDSAEIIWKI